MNLFTLNVIIPLIFAICNATASTDSSSEKVNIINQIWQFVSGMVDNFFDPIPSNNPILAINNLQPTSLVNIKHYVHFAFAAYCSENNLKLWKCASCRTLGPDIRYITQVSHNLYNTMAFFAVDDTRKEIVLSFSGASNLANFVLVATFVKVRVNDNSDIRLHAGFYTTTLSLYHKVVEELRRLTQANPSYKVIMTGHSKGGAEAALTIFLFKLNNIFNNTNFELYTYGEPRFGNQAFATYFNSLNIPAARVVNDADMIPHVISPAALGYVHRQNEVWIVKNVSKFCSGKYYEDMSCSNSRGPQFSLYDHFYYFDADYNACILEDPVSFALQAVINLKPYLPKGLLEYLGLNMLNISSLSSSVIRPIGLFVRTQLIH